MTKEVEALLESTRARPDQTATVAAQTYLSTAQIRLDDYRTATKKEAASKAASHAAKSTYDTYCRVMEESLTSLYEEVQDDFSKFYRDLNGGDEAQFTAKFTPSEGALDFAVNFYERGLFPPGAYHSEGHQDGMGVCLYLALMKRVFGKHFNLALLDDVVMSVDSEHRREFCRLLKNHFPDTQFIITTHDRLWAEQMKHAGLVTSKTAVEFHSWTVDSGPLVQSSASVWCEIDQSLAKGRIDVAAAALRRHLEFLSRQFADLLGASPQFRSDGGYELGDLLPSAVSRLKELLGKAADAAQSWKNDEKRKLASQHKDQLSACNGVLLVEQWAVNKAVHYNEWANFGRKDFEPVVTAFKELLDRFRCSTCSSWIYVSPRRGSADSLRCDCAAFDFNLKKAK